MIETALVRKKGGKPIIIYSWTDERGRSASKEYEVDEFEEYVRKDRVGLKRVSVMANLENLQELSDIADNLNEVIESGKDGRGSNIEKIKNNLI